jgi:adenylyltransferase/sulfurtransferase
LIPAAQFVQRLGEFDPASEIVIHCKSGGRSARAVEIMKGRGFTNARNLTGGVLAWINEIDPSQRKY